MQKHLFVPLTKDNNGSTIYQIVEDYIKNAVIRAAATGSHRPMTEAAAEWKIAEGSISNTRTKEIYQLPPELVEVLRSAEVVSDLNAFVFRGTPAD